VLLLFEIQMEPMRSAFIQKQSGTGRAFPTVTINASEKKDALAIFIMTCVLKIVENRHSSVSPLTADQKIVTAQPR
jgi:hypothetical protein